MGVDVDQSRNDELAAGVDGLGGIARDIFLDRHDPAAGDRNIPHRIEAGGRIDHASTLDDQIVARRESPGHLDCERGARGAEAQQPAAVDPGR